MELVSAGAWGQDARGGILAVATAAAGLGRVGQTLTSSLLSWQGQPGLPGPPGLPVSIRLSPGTGTVRDTPAPGSSTYKWGWNRAGTKP